MILSIPSNGSCWRLKCPYPDDTTHAKCLVYFKNESRMRWEIADVFLGYPTSKQIIDRLQALQDTGNVFAADELERYKAKPNDG